MKAVKWKYERGFLGELEQEPDHSRCHLLPIIARIVVFQSLVLDAMASLREQGKLFNIGISLAFIQGSSVERPASSSDSLSLDPTVAGSTALL